MICYIVLVCRDMRRGQPWGGGAEPNAYTYSVLLKAMGDQVRAAWLPPCISQSQVSGKPLST